MKYIQPNSCYLDDGAKLVIGEGSPGKGALRGSWVHTGVQDNQNMPHSCHANKTINLPEKQLKYLPAPITKKNKASHEEIFRKIINPEELLKQLVKT